MAELYPPPSMYGNANPQSSQCDLLWEQDLKGTIKVKGGGNGVLTQGDWWS